MEVLLVTHRGEPLRVADLDHSVLTSDWLAGWRKKVDGMLSSIDQWKSDVRLSYRFLDTSILRALPLETRWSIPS